MESRDRGKYVPGIRICEAGVATQLRARNLTAPNTARGLIVAAGFSVDLVDGSAACYVSDGQVSGIWRSPYLLTREEKEHIIDVRACADLGESSRAGAAVGCLPDGGRRFPSPCSWARWLLSGHLGGWNGGSGMAGT